MAKTIHALFALLLAASVCAQEPHEIEGVWLSEDKGGKFEIYSDNDLFYGRLIWMKDAYEADGKTLKTDKHNPDESLRSRPLKGLLVLKSLKYHKGEWTGGQIYDPQTGKTYSCRAKIRGDELILRGFWGVSLLGRSTVWTSVKPGE